MTRTISNKISAKQGTAIFLDQLKKLRTPMIVFGIISVFFTSAIFALSTVIFSSTEFSYYLSLAESAKFFCNISASMVFFLTTIFSLIYALRATSYLHNKRKADMIFPMPVKSGVMFMSKLLAAYAAAIIPSLFLIGIISTITLCMGAPVDSGILQLFWTIPIGSAACILFFGLMAICCGTTANTILTFLTICFAFPLSMNFIRGAIKAFFIGIPLNFGDDFFLFKALNPFAAYDGLNIVYWLLFIIGCIALELLLLKNRKSERAQTSYAYRLPCYMVEVLVTFIVGMLTGTIFGMMKVMAVPFAGFVFGFVLGGSAAFVICHLILFHGFARILKSLIFYGAVTTLAIGFIAVCEFTSPMFTNYVPDKKDIASAGFIDFSNRYSTTGVADYLDINEAIPQSSGDFSDTMTKERIRAEHQNAVEFIKKMPNNYKFSKMLFSPMFDAFDILGGDDSFGVSYKLSDGSTVSRYYSGLDEGYPFFYDGEYTFFEKTGNAEIIKQSDTYLEKYAPLCAVPFENIEKINVSVNGNTFKIGENSDAEKIYNALREDYKEHGYDGDNAYLVYDSDGINVSYDLKEKTGKRGFWPLLNDYIDDYSYVVPNNYKRTIKALQEAGIIDSKQKAVKTSPYYSASKWDDDIDYSIDYLDESSDGAYESI